MRRSILTGVSDTGARPRNALFAEVLDRPAVCACVRKRPLVCGAHLFDVQIPMLFLQGTRDALADLALLRLFFEAGQGLEGDPAPDDRRQAADHRNDDPPPPASLL